MVRGGGACQSARSIGAMIVAEHRLREGGFMEARRFRYYFKLKRGALRYGEGASAEEAARDAGVRMVDVKRCMPVKVVLTETEREAQRQRFVALRQRQNELD